MLLAIGWIMIGWGISKALGGLIKTLKMVKNAENMRDLDAAAKKLAKTLVSLGVDTFIGLLTRGAGKLKRRTNAKRQPIAAPAPDSARRQQRQSQKDRAVEKRKADEAEAQKEKGATLTASKQHDVECFNKPTGVKDKDFNDQLREQETAINNTNADTILERRQAIKDAGGTTPLRDLKAQSAARTDYKLGRMEELGRLGTYGEQAESLVAKEMKSLHATHRLDIIAGGDPSDISGLASGKVNSSLGSQWKGRRSQSLENFARDMENQGMGGQKMNVKLRKC